MPRLRVNLAVEQKVCVTDLLGLVRNDYDVRRLKSERTVVYPMRHVEAALGGAMAVDLSEDDLVAYVRARREAKAAESSIRTELHMLRRGYRLAVRARLLRATQVPDFPVISADRLRVRRGFLSEEQVRQVQARLDGDLADFVAFLFASAWRKGEASALVWDWVDDDAIRLPDSKSGHPRVLPIAGEVEEILLRRRERRLGEFVFHRGGAPIGDFRQQWRRAVAQAGLEGRLVHDLRRSAIKRMIEAGADQRTAMAFSGHKTVHTFHRYQIVDLARMRDVAALVRKRPPEHLARPEKRLSRRRKWG